MRFVIHVVHDRAMTACVQHIAAAKQRVDTLNTIPRTLFRWSFNPSALGKITV